MSAELGSVIRSSAEVMAPAGLMKSWHSLATIWVASSVSSRSVTAPELSADGVAKAGVVMGSANSGSGHATG